MPVASRPGKGENFLITLGPDNLIATPEDFMPQMPEPEEASGSLITIANDLDLKRELVIREQLKKNRP